MLRLFAIIRVINFFHNKMYKVIFKFAFTLLSIIFFFAALMMMIENLAIYETIREEKELIRKDPLYIPDEDIAEMGGHYYHDMLYYMMCTISTVGFGDISPATRIGQFLYIVIMCTFAVNVEK